MATKNPSTSTTSTPTEDAEQHTILCFKCRQPMDGDSYVYYRGEPIHRDCY